MHFLRGQRPQLGRLLCVWGHRKRVPEGPQALEQQFCRLLRRMEVHTKMQERPPDRRVRLLQRAVRAHLQSVRGHGLRLRDRRPVLEVAEVPEPGPG